MPSYLWHARHPHKSSAPNIGKLFEIGIGFLRFKLSIREMNKVAEEMLKAQCEIEYGQMETIYLLIGKTPPRFVGLSHTINVLVENDVEILSPGY